MVKDILTENFQGAVEELLTRNRSILDILSKMQSAQAKVHRAITKAVTHCGCISLDARKQSIPDDSSYDQLHELMDPHIRGELCDDCRDVIETEMGGHLFYMTSLCNTLGLNLYDVILKEQERLQTLGRFHMR